MAAADGARRPGRRGGAAIERLQALQAQKLITIQDAAVVSWPADKKKPKTPQLNNLAGAGALGGAFWACCSA